MEALRKIVIIACLLAIAIAIVDMLYPSKKFDKQVHLIFSLIFLIGIITPFLSGSVNFNLSDISTVEQSQNYVEIQDNVNKQYVSTIESNISCSLSTLLNQNQINIKEISTKVNIAEDNSISISKVNIACNNINDNQKILNLIQSEVGQEVNVVINQGE